MVIYGDSSVVWVRQYIYSLQTEWYGIVSTLQIYLLTQSLIFIGNLFATVYPNVHILLIVLSQKANGFPFHYFRSLWKYFPIVHIPLSL